MQTQSKDIAGALLEAAPDAIIAVDADGQIVLANAQAQCLFGYGRDELVGQLVELLVPDGVMAAHPRHREDYLRDPRPRPMGAGVRLAARRRDGSEFPAEISLSAIDTEEGILVAAAVRDVSDRVRAEAKFRGLLEAAPDAIVGVGADGRIVLVNAQAERLFGYGRDELVGQLVELLVPAANRASHPGHRNHYLADPVARPMGAGMELAARRKDGSEFPAEISLSAIDTEDGLLVSAAIRDVSERRRSAEVRNQLASIVQSSRDAIVGKTLSGVITTWNPGAERLYGYSTEEMIGQHGQMLFPAEKRAAEAELLELIGRGEWVDQYETERLRKDGTKVTVSLTMSPITDADGSVIGLASVSRDISDRQRAEAMFRGLLEAAPDAIVGVTPDGRINLANAQAERLFGYTREELIGQLIEMLVPERARAVHPHHRSQYFHQPQPRPMGAGMQLVARRKDGTEFPAEISLAPLDTPDGVIVSAAIRDITDRLVAQAERERLTAATERERMEAQLHQSQRLESLGQLAGGVAHDFNNILGVMLNFAAFVAEQVARAAAGGGDDEDWHTAKSDIDQVIRAGERATQLTRQLLAFGRRDVARPQVLNLNSIVTEVEQLLRRTLGEHVTLDTSLADDLHPVLADPGQLEQVLVNLAVNARDAMPDGGGLRVVTTNRPIDDTTDAQLPAGEYIELRVTDTGAGIPPDIVERVFEPFFTTKAKGDGSGLGLATVYGIITQAGGHATISSVVGAGTTFTVLLPVTDESATPGEDQPVTDRQHQGGNASILVVDDEPGLRDVARRILTRNGYHVITAQNGPEALEIIATDVVIDVLLTDVIMPHMLGKELANAMAERRPGIRVLYMSGYAQPVLAAQGTLEPGVTLLEKPFSESALLKQLREVLAATT